MASTPFKLDDGALPALEPLHARLTDAEKRERQRLHVKRSYYRKLNLMQSLRDDVRQLEQEYDRLLAEKAKRDVQNSPQSPSTAILPHSLDGRPLHELYDEIRKAEHHLRVQNEALRVALAEHERASQQMRALMLEADFQEEQVLTNSQSPNKIQPRELFPIVQLRAPITADICREIGRRTFEEMQSFRESHGFLSTGVSVFGWRDKRIFEGNRVKYSMKKLFHGITPFDLSLRGWSVVTSNQLLRGLYSSSLNVRVWLVQRVDDDNEIRFRTMSSPDGQLIIKTLFLATRFEAPCGYVYILRSLDPKDWLVPYQNPPGVREQWVHYYNWAIFEPVGDHGEHCYLDFGGETLCTDLAGPATWMVEVLAVVLRWESFAVGPVFTIC